MTRWHYQIVYHLHHFILKFRQHVAWLYTLIVLSALLLLVLAITNNPPEEIVPPRSEQDILSEILNHTRGLSNRVRSLESELNYKSKNSYDFDNKKIVFEIIDMMESGKYSSDQIANILVDYNIPKEYAHGLVNKTIKDYKVSKNTKQDFKSHIIERGLNTV